jgi:hypothetical protein
VRALYVRLSNRAINVSAPVAIRRQRESGLRLRLGAALLTAAVLAACAPDPKPRTVFDFMEDGLAREGVLTRCNRDRDATLADEECANARRAAAAVALEAERARESELERSSEAKLAAVSAREGGERPEAASSVPAFGAPVGAVMPSMAQSFDVYANGADPLGRRSLEVEDVAPPANELEIQSPQLAVTDLAIVPRPFRDDGATQP